MEAVGVLQAINVNLLIKKDVSLCQRYKKLKISMLNRRHIRVKVLQSLYSYSQSGVYNLEQGEKTLIKDIHKLYEMYLYHLFLLREICDYTTRYANAKESNFMSAIEKNTVNRKLATNTVAVQLFKDPIFNQELARHHIGNYHDTPDILERIFKKLLETEQYTQYLAQTQHSTQDDVAILMHIYTTIIMENESCDDHFEEISIFWQSDADLITIDVVKFLKDFELFKAIQLQPISKNWEIDKDFAIQLFRQVILNKNEYEQYIADNAQNWDSERIALTDMHIMMLAITESIYFNEIPIKVTINEFLEVAKYYSTPKSTIFINGILDKIILDLKEKGIVKKIGRGLVE